MRDAGVEKRSGERSGHSYGPGTAGVQGDQNNATIVMQTGINGRIKPIG